MNDSKKIAAVYNKFGIYYHKSRKNASGRLHNEFIDRPATFSLLPDDLSGKTVLDAGCGSGIYSIFLAKKGAKVIGVDVSSRMIEIAKKETAKQLNIAYQVGDLYSLPFEKSAFDIIVCTYVLENIENINKVFAQFYSILKPNGVCIFSVSHPIRANSKKMENNSKEIWVIEDYFKTGLRQSDFGGGMIVPKYKRTIQSYVDSLSNAGFVIERILEPQPIKEGKEADSKNYEKSTRLPQILTMRISKFQ